jgi:hypothetical protein
MATTCLGYLSIAKNSGYLIPKEFNAQIRPNYYEKLTDYLSANWSMERAIQQSESL